MIVTGALSEPKVTSPSGPVSAKSAGDGLSSAQAGGASGRIAPLSPVMAKAKGAVAARN